MSSADVRITLQSLKHIRRKSHSRDGFLAGVLGRKKVYLNGQTADEPSSWEEENHIYQLHDDGSFSMIPEDQGSNQLLLSKYLHLISANEPQGFNSYQSMLLNLQIKLDEYLDFSKNHRGRRKGDFYRTIRQNLIESSKVYLEMVYFRQLLAIDPNLYLLTSKQRGLWNNELIIELPPNANLLLRRKAFRRKMREYTWEYGWDERGNCNGESVVPTSKLRSESVSPRAYKEQLRQQEPSQDRLDPLDILTIRNVNFKAKLYQLIREKEERLHLDALNSKNNHYTRSDRLKVLTEIQMIFLVKHISNMFLATLLEVLERRLPYSIAVARGILEEILLHCGCYIKRIYHPKGLILQIEKSQYAQARTNLIEIAD